MTEIPIESGVPSQTLKVDLEGNTYNFRIIYNSRTGVWTFDLTDEDDVDLVSGVAMVLGASLIGQFNLGIGALAMVEQGATGLDATADDLGERILLVHLTEEDIANLETLIDPTTGFPYEFPLVLS